MNVRVALVLTGISLAAAALGQSPLTRDQASFRARKLAELGRKMFFDPSLSASGRISCASCHDPRFAYGPPNALPVQPGGQDGKQWGTRAVPSLRYLQVIPPFSEHYFDETAGDDSVDAGPVGGLTWDGRVDRARDQARIPLLSPNEMANKSPAAVVHRVKSANYSSDFQKLLPSNPDIEAAFAVVLEAFEAWEQDPREFYPYTSKYDAWLAGKARLTEQELRGWNLFRDPAKGNCARCHIASPGANGTPPEFTDYGLVAIGVPRNSAIPANQNPAWYDLGVCGPERRDLRSRSEFCGRFMTPTLRNVALRQTFFHNGIFHSLKEVVEFYAQRDTNPEKWYNTRKFDDLPPEYRRNIDQEAPFGRSPGEKPALTGAEIADLVAFLETLTDAPNR